MIITSLLAVPEDLYVEVEDENRRIRRLKVIAIAGLADASGNGTLAPVSIVDGKFNIGGKNLIQTDTLTDIQ